MSKGYLRQFNRGAPGRGHPVFGDGPRGVAECRAGGSPGKGPDGTSTASPAAGPLGTARPRLPLPAVRAHPPQGIFRSERSLFQATYRWVLYFYPLWEVTAPKLLRCCTKNCKLTVFSSLFKHCYHSVLGQCTGNLKVSSNCTIIPIFLNLIFSKRFCCSLCPFSLPLLPLYPRLLFPPCLPILPVEKRHQM